MSEKIKSAVRFIFFLGIGVGIMYWLYTSQESSYQLYCAENGIAAEDCSLMDKLASDFGSVRWLWIILMLIAYMMSNVSRVLRWQMMLKSIGHPSKFGTAFIATMTGYFANSLIPRSGEIARAGFLSFKNKTPMEKVLGTIAVDRSIDLLSLGLVILLGFALEYDILYGFVSENMKMPGSGLLTNPVAWVIGLLGILGMATLFFFRKKLGENRIFKLFWEKLMGFWEGIVSVKNVDNPLLFLFHSFVIWFMYYLMMWLGLQSFAPTADLSAATALIVFVFGTLGIVIPSPGGLGAYQVLVTTCLSQFYGLEYTDAFSYSNIAFWPVYFLNIGIGILLLPFVMSYFTKGKSKTA